MVDVHPSSRSRQLSCLRAAASFALLAVVLGCSASEPLRQRPLAQASPQVSADDSGYLRGVDGKLVDDGGRPMRLVGVSWFGFETGTCALHGLSVRNWRDMLDQIREAGFNVLRLPITNQFLDDPSCQPMGIDYRLNPDLQGKSGLALLDVIVNGAARRGLRVILDRHSPAPGLRGSDLWYTDDFPQWRWIDDWVMLARHYLNNRAVIGADVANEPHGSATWGDGNVATDWRLAAESVGNAILNVNPHWLILVEGIQYYDGDQYWWGGQLKGAALYPVRLSHPDKLVYSPHDYGPAVSPQAWFWAPTFPRNLAQVWDLHWGNLVEMGTPVLVGEFSGCALCDERQSTWQRTLISYLNERGIGSIYWAWNPDSADTDGMLQADWTTLNQRELVSVLGPQASPAPAASQARASSKA